MSMLHRHLALFLLGLAGAALIVWPAGDLWIAGLFYDPIEGFHLKQHPVNQFIFDLVPWVSRAVIAGLLVFLLLAWTWRKTDSFFLAHRKAMLYLLLVALIGPLFVVNSVFKDHWGRARPSQIAEFGGSKEFSRAAVPTDQCAKNCSFVSGHASTGFFFLAPAFVFAGRRRTWLAVGTVSGLGIGLVRMMQGGHFLSDVLFSGVVVYLTAWAVHAWMYRKPHTQ
jgi:lipid A 4'-phosphatase